MVKVGGSIFLSHPEKCPECDRSTLSTIYYLLRKEVYFPFVIGYKCLYFGCGQRFTPRLQPIPRAEPTEIQTSTAG